MSIEGHFENTEKSKYVHEYLPNEVVSELRRHITEIGSHNFSFVPLFVDHKTYQASKIVDEGRAKLGLKIKVTPESVGNAFSSIYERLIENGFNGSQSDLLIRWVGVRDSNEVSLIMDESEKNGGKIDNKDGLNMSHIGSKADDYFAAHLTNGEYGVLFLYDGRKLESLSNEESASDVMFVAGYGYKPKEGEDYKTALIGGIGF